MSNDEAEQLRAIGAPAKQPCKTYRVVPYDHDQPNEANANLAEHVLTIASDCNVDTDGQDGAITDVSDLLACVRHFCDRAGIDYDVADGSAQRAYEGDLGAGPIAQRDTERFPDE